MKLDHFPGTPGIILLCTSVEQHSGWKTLQHIHLCSSLSVQTAECGDINGRFLQPRQRVRLMLPALLSSTSQLCHGVVDALCGRQPPRRSDCSSATCSPEEWLELLDSLTALFRLAVGNDSSDEEVTNTISSIIQWFFLNDDKVSIYVIFSNTLYHLNIQW